MIQLFPLGDSAFQVKFGDTISEETLLKIRAFMQKVEEAEIAGVTEMVPSYTDLIIHYQPLKTDYKSLVTQLKKLENLF